MAGGGLFSAGMCPVNDSVLYFPFLEDSLLDELDMCSIMQAHATVSGFCPADGADSVSEDIVAAFDMLDEYAGAVLDDYAVMSCGMIFANAADNFFEEYEMLPPWIVYPHDSYCLFEDHMVHCKAYTDLYMIFVEYLISNGRFDDYCVRWPVPAHMAGFMLQVVFDKDNTSGIWQQV